MGGCLKESMKKVAPVKKTREKAQGEKRGTKKKKAKENNRITLPSKKRPDTARNIETPPVLESLPKPTGCPVNRTKASHRKKND